MIPCAYPTNGETKGVSRREATEDQQRSSGQNLSGEVLRKRTLGPFTISEHFYQDASTLPKHSHRYALLTFLIEGAFREHCGSDTVVCRPGALRFIPPGEVHADEFESRVRCLHVAIGRDVLDGLDRRAVVPRRPAEITGLSATWLANRLYAEFSRADKASGIAVEGLVLEILAEIARAQSGSERASMPRWLKQATEIVESRFLERLSLAEIAAEVGVHYVHLSRQFHKYNRCTVGELIRRRRIQYASHLLAHSRTPLAQIALICGFSDQSHLSFLFKRYMGLSPSKFRGLAGARPELQPVTSSEQPIDLDAIDARRRSKGVNVVLKPRSRD